MSTDTVAVDREATCGVEFGKHPSMPHLVAVCNLPKGHDRHSNTLPKTDPHAVTGWPDHYVARGEVMWCRFAEEEVSTDTVAVDREALAKALHIRFGPDLADLEWEEQPEDVREDWREDADALIASGVLRDADEVCDEFYDTAVKPTINAIRDEAKAEGAAEVRARVEAVTSFVQFDTAGNEVEWLNRAHVLDTIGDPNSRYLNAAMELARNEGRAEVRAVVEVRHYNDAGFCDACGAAWPCPAADLDDDDAKVRHEHGQRIADAILAYDQEWSANTWRSISAGIARDLSPPP